MTTIDDSLWKSVPINLDGDFEGLIGFEEITDYKIEKSKEGSPKKNKKKKKKREFTENPESSLPNNKKLKKTHNAFVETVVSETQERFDEEDYYPWTNIHVPREIIQSLLEEGFTEPTEIQRLAIPPALKGKKDILGAAETGSGKTLAFAIPIIYGILKNLEKEKDEEEKEGKLWALVLTPTRELAIQVKNHIEIAIKHTPLKVAVVVGGMSAEKQSRILKRKPEIVVATPGRLWDLITNSNEPHFSNISDIRFLVIDETDRMMETNHFPELRSLIEKINVDPDKAKQRQYFVFSATLSLVHQLPDYIQKKKRGKKELSSSQKLSRFVKLLGMSNPKIVDITQKSGTASGLTEAKIVSSFDEKDFYLYYFLSVYPGRCVIFCNSISCVRRLASLLNALELKPLPLHANMQQRQRLKNLDRFKANDKGILLATDVAARGLDIPSVEHVIHYQVPRTSETYIHRSGRTARAQKKGLTVLLIEPSEASLYNRLCATLDRDKDVPDFPIDHKLLKEAKERVKLARDIDKISLTLRKEKSQIGWIEKAAQDMDLVLDDDQKPASSGESEIADQKRRMEFARKRLKKLLIRPLSLNTTVDSVISSNNLKKKIKIVKKKKKNL